MRISDWSSDVCSSDLDADHALNACAAALSMATALDRLNAEALDDARKGMAGAELLRIGVGINTGLCVVGNMGSEQRFDYSVLGAAVNLAARDRKSTRLNSSH